MGKNKKKVKKKTPLIRKATGDSSVKQETTEERAKFQSSQSSTFPLPLSTPKDKKEKEEEKKGEKEAEDTSLEGKVDTIKRIYEHFGGTIAEPIIEDTYNLCQEDFVQTVGTLIEIFASHPESGIEINPTHGAASGKELEEELRILDENDEVIQQQLEEDEIYARKLHEEFQQQDLLTSNLSSPSQPSVSSSSYATAVRFRQSQPDERVTNLHLDNLSYNYLNSEQKRLWTKQVIKDLTAHHQVLIPQNQALNIFQVDEKLSKDLHKSYEEEVKIERGNDSVNIDKNDEDDDGFIAVGKKNKLQNKSLKQRNKSSKKGRMEQRELDEFHQLKLYASRQMNQEQNIYTRNWFVPLFSFCDNTITSAQSQSQSSSQFHSQFQSPKIKRKAENATMKKMGNKEESATGSLSLSSEEMWDIVCLHFENILSVSDIAFVFQSKEKKDKLLSNKYNLNHQYIDHSESNTLLQEYLDLGTVLLEKKNEVLRFPKPKSYTDIVGYNKNNGDDCTANDPYFLFLKDLYKNHESQARKDVQQFYQEYEISSDRNTTTICSDSGNFYDHFVSTTFTNRAGIVQRRRANALTTTKKLSFHQTHNAHQSQTQIQTRTRSHEKYLSTTRPMSMQVFLAMHCENNPTNDNTLRGFYDEPEDNPLLEYCEQVYSFRSRDPAFFFHLANFFLNRSSDNRERVRKTFKQMREKKQNLTDFGLTNREERRDMFLCNRLSVFFRLIEKAPGIVVQPVYELLSNIKENCLPIEKIVQENKRRRGNYAEQQHQLDDSEEEELEDIISQLFDVVQDLSPDIEERIYYGGDQSRQYEIDSPFPVLNILSHDNITKIFGSSLVEKEVSVGGINYIYSPSLQIDLHMCLKLDAHQLMNSIFSYLRNCDLDKELDESFFEVHAKRRKPLRKGLSLHSIERMMTKLHPRVDHTVTKLYPSSSSSSSPSGPDTISSFSFVIWFLVGKGLHSAKAGKSILHSTVKRYLRERGARLFNNRRQAAIIDIKDDGQILLLF